MTATIGVKAAPCLTLAVRGTVYAPRVLNATEPVGGRTSAQSLESPRFWTSAGIVFVGNVVARALGFAFPLALTHITSRTEFALVYFFVATGFAAGELVLSGFPIAVTRRLAAEAGNPDRGRWLAAGLAGGVPFLAASLVIGEMIAAAAGAPAILMSVVVVGLTIDAYYFAALRGLQRFGLLMTYRIAANVGQLLLLFGAAGLGILNVPVAVSIYGLSYLVPIVVVEMRWAPVRRLLNRTAHVTRDHVKTLTRFALPALVSGTSYGAVMGLDVFFVGSLAPQSLPDYGAARALAVPILMVPYAVTIVLMPRAAASDDAERNRLLRVALTAVTAVGLATVTAYLVFAPLAVSLVLPESYATAVAPMRTLAPALAVLGTYVTLEQWWLAIGRPEWPAATLVVGAIASGATHLLVTAQHGAVGGGAAIAVGAVVALVLLGAVTLRRSRIDRDSLPYRT